MKEIYSDIALKALFHDIDKFANKSIEELKKDKNFIKTFNNLNINLDNIFSFDEIVDLAGKIAREFEKEKTNKNKHLKSLFDKNKEYKIDKLSPKNIFSVKSSEIKDNKNIWNDFLEDLKKVKDRNAIDYLYKKYTTFIPSPHKSNVPLYDHSKTTSLFAIAIEKLLKNGENIDEIQKGNNFLLIAGDFFGIQNFIFDRVKAKYASKILRSRSAYVEILTKIAALYLVKKIKLDELSIINSSAGKFEILAPNLDYIKEKLNTIKKEFDEFFIKKYFGLTGIGLIAVECGIKDFIRKDKEIPYKKLRKKIADKIELMKMEKFSSINNFMMEYEKDLNNENLCDFCEIRKGNTKEKNYKICETCNLFKELGENLTKKDFLNIYINEKFEDCKFVIDFNKNGDYVFDLSKDDKFRGYEKLEISSYVATSKILDEKEKEYLNNENLITEDIEKNKILTFEDLAKLSVIDGVEENKRKRGIEAIGVFKGDVDFMGNFIQGLNDIAKEINVTASFSKFNFFSRLINYFFSVYAPYLMKKKYKKIYTIFTGGDDIYIVGSWDEIIGFIKELRNNFINFCENQMKISGGFVLTKPNKPINFISKVVEEAEKEAKDYKKNQDYLKKEKNAFCSFGETVSFNEYTKKEIDNLLEKYKDYLNTSFLYRLLDFCEMSKNTEKNPLNAMWISKYEYIFRRNLEEIYKEIDFNELKNNLKNYIENEPSNLKIKLYEFIYKRRKNG